MDLEARTDDRTAAVISVDYFGFSQPAFADVDRVAADRGCYDVEDNVHSPLSVVDGALLGTRGDLGFTSIRKLLSVTNGAVLYVTDDAVADRFVPSGLATPTIVSRSGTTRSSCGRSSGACSQPISTSGAR